MKINPYYLMIQRLAKDERLTINGLAEKYNLGRGFASSIYRMKGVPNRVPHPETLGKIERNIGIEIDDSNINHITYKHKNELNNDRVANVAKNKPIVEASFQSLPLIEEDQLESIIRIIQQSSGGSNSKLSTVSDRQILYSGNCSENSVAWRIADDSNEPFILSDDIIILDLDKKVENENYAALILNDLEWYVGRFYQEEDIHIISFYNYNYNPKVVNRNQVSKVFKIVGIIRELQ